MVNQLPFERIVLASQSPRRLALLQQLGLYPHVLPMEIDETVRIHEDPLSYVQRVSDGKARAAQVQLHDDHALIIAADTSVVQGEIILGKPIDQDQAFEMIKQLQGGCHEVITAVSCAYQGQWYQTHCVSQVWFCQMSNDEIVAYCQTDEPYDKAGGYAVQGIAAQYIERIEGSYSGIMGLPLYELSVLLKHIAIRSVTLL